MKRPESFAIDRDCVAHKVAIPDGKNGFAIFLDFRNQEAAIRDRKMSLQSSLIA